MTDMSQTKASLFLTAVQWLEYQYWHHVPKTPFLRVMSKRCMPWVALHRETPSRRSSNLNNGQYACLFFAPE